MSAVTEMSPRILLIEDDAAIVELLRYNLESEGLRPTIAMTGEEAEVQVSEDRFDLIVLDWMLPGLSGIELCRRLRRREATRNVPILMLTARGEEGDRVRGLATGADDYVVKPFSMAELLARARTALRRQARGAKGEPLVKVGRLTIDLAARAVLIEGIRVVLSPKEYRLLQVLAQHAGNVVTHNTLLKEVWGAHHLSKSHYLRILVRKLRRKIEYDPKQPRILVSELGVGYRLAGGSDSD